MREVAGGPAHLGVRLSQSKRTPFGPFRERIAPFGIGEFTHMRLFKIALLTIAAASTLSAGLYSQTPCPLATCFGSSFFTESFPGPEVGDPFTPDSNWFVGGIAFRGGILPSSAAPTVDFEIRFYADNAGLP